MNKLYGVMFFFYLLSVPLWSATTAEGVLPWPQAIIPYVSYVEDGQLGKDIHRAVDEINSLNVVKFIGYHSYEEFRESGHPNAVIIEYKEKNCSASGFGWRNGPNNLIKVSEDCRYGSILHELLHVAGLIHEQGHPEARQSGDLVFYQIRTYIDPSQYEVGYDGRAAIALTEYDPNSIMHYASLDNTICDFPNSDDWDAAVEGLPHVSCRTREWRNLRAENNGGVDCHQECATLIHREYGLISGQREGLSELDKKGLKIFYKNASSETRTNR